MVHILICMHTYILIYSKDVTSSYRTHMFSHPPVFLIAWGIAHVLHALELPESSDSEESITEHHKGGLRKGLTSDIRKISNLVPIGRSSTILFEQHSRKWQPRIGMCFCFSEYTGIFAIAIQAWLSMYVGVEGHRNESCRIWMRHVTYEYVMPHMNVSRHVWRSHVTYECVMSHINVSHHICISHGHITYKWDMSHMIVSWHTWMSHVVYKCVKSHVNAPCHVWMSHVIYE